MDTKEIFAKALSIAEPWYVADVIFEAERKKLTISVDFKKGSLFHYESEDKRISGDYKAYDTVEKEWRHLNFFEHECYLKARVPRVMDEDGKVHIVYPSWCGLMNGFTLLFEALIMQLAKAMPIHQVSKITKESDYKIWNIVDKYVESTVELNDYSKLTAVGLDETSMSKGHDYVTLFVDLNKRRTIFVTKGKDAKTIEAFKLDLELHQGKVENIKDVSCDMSPAFISGLKKDFAEAQITFDKFHILKIINEAVDEVRRKESANNPLLKGSRYVFLKNDCNLTQEQQRMKQKLLLPKLNLKSAKALMIRESFQQIYLADSYDHFEALLNKWYFWATHSRLEPIKAAAKTIKKHWYGVLSWKKSQINNGILEGLNSIVQAAKAKARGYNTFKHFKNIIYLITGNLDFRKVNINYLPT
jgi:transposase